MQLIAVHSALAFFELQGWLTYQTRKAGDARVKRAMGEAYAIAYGLQALALARAQWAAPESHSALNVLGIFLFASLSGFYAHCRWRRTIKVFELPSEHDRTIA
jgi:hypothetical protein